MKKLLLALCAMFSVVMTQAQEHMVFKGISMGCDLTTFVSQLQAKGYTAVSVNDETALLLGNFAGTDGCKIGVVCTANSKQVCQVMVIFPTKNSWHSLKKEYLFLKESYTVKYGVPDSCEYFSAPYADGDGFEMAAVSAGRCNYYSLFEMTQGRIMLGIADDMSIGVVYEDNVNSELMHKEKQSVISSDI